eukprot:scaffold298500_cov80-Attheya_sp.AAC.1
MVHNDKKDMYSTSELTNGNSLLSDEEINMLVVLRMNRKKFMAFMRSHFNHISHQTFKQTILKQVDNDEKAEE